ncbi:hypothetical protein ACP70R_035530 [Stipagrostis hirtigluma subsp. patula]
MASIRRETAKLDAVLQRPAAAVFVEGKRAEHERVLLGHLGVAQPPLADPYAAVPAQHVQPLHGLRHAAPRQAHNRQPCFFRRYGKGNGARVFDML